MRRKYGVMSAGVARWRLADAVEVTEASLSMLCEHEKAGYQGWSSR